jgi:hypothetical protein
VKRFTAKEFARLIGRQGGKANTPAQNAARAANAKKARRAKARGAR